MVRYTQEEAAKLQCPLMLMQDPLVGQKDCIGHQCMAWVWDSPVDDMGDGRFVKRGTINPAKGGVWIGHGAAMRSCSRCHGLLARQWDEDAHEEYRYCLICGHRPMLEVRRADGQPLGSRNLCIDCHVKPVMMIDHKCMKTEKEAVRCAGCRERHNRRRRALKWWKERANGPRPSGT